jgi:hypothetical protein
MLRELTDALAVAEHDDEVMIDATGHVAWVDSALEDVDRRRHPGLGFVVLRPDGLWEWAMRRDFVRRLERGSAAKKKLALTLAGPKTRRRFEVALSTEPRLEREFTLHRRRRLRAWAARVLRTHAVPVEHRASVAALVTAATEASARAAASIRPLTPRQKARQRRRRAKQIRRNRAR